MRRLVYSPKCFAWVRTQDHGIINISKYLVNGNVQRRINAVSSAELTLRNPDRKWTALAHHGRPIFRPMDPITIWMQRLRERPVQVFTGYLDTAPYLQLYPGTVQLTASCTLKRLLHTYWDPALPFVNEFMRYYGWVADRGSGVLRNLNAEQAPIKHNTTGAPELNDGGFGNLLFAVLKHIGDWDKNTIRIESLPPQLIEDLTNVYYAFDRDAKIVRDEFHAFIKGYIGDGQYGGGGGGDSGGEGGESTGVIKGAEKAVPILVKAASKHGIPPKFVVGMCIIESNLGNNTHNPPYTGPFQQNITAPPYGNAGINHTPTKKEAEDMGLSADLFCRATKVWLRRNPSWKNDLYKLGIHVQGVQNHLSNQSPDFRDPSQFAKRMREGERLVRQFGNKVGTDDKDDDDYTLKNPTPDQADRNRAAEVRDARDRKKRNPWGGPEEGAAQRAMSDESKRATKLYAPIAGNHAKISSPWGPRWGRNHNGIDVPCPVGTDCVAPADGKIGAWSNTSGFGKQGGMIHFVFTKDVGDIKKGTVIGWGHVNKVNFKPGDKVKAGQVIAKSGYPAAPHVHFIQRSDGAAPDGTTDPAPLFKALMKGESSPTEGGEVSEGDGGGDSADVSYQDVLSTAKATAFVQEMSFPGIMETLEAVTLRGPKSLMNDKPLFPFIEQLSGASVRSFQSLPNGDFFAFFPDYFGTMFHRKPYWHVHDIEILDGNMEITDDKLATHVYVVGDTIPGTPGVDHFERLVSTGVVNIYNITQSGFRAGNKDDDKAGEEQRKKTNPDDVIEFMTRYGARPVLEEAPFIRSPFFEAFLAYYRFQQLWSQQFSTDFQFTFMPEVFPGGLIGFPNHGLQCYVEEVTHSFDYEGGFQTTATLSSPATLNEQKLTSDPLQWGLVRAHG